MDKAVVIGGSGFLGSYIADVLTLRGYDVCVYDRDVSQWLQKQQKIVVGDLLDQEALTECCKDVRYIFHFGGIADIEESTVKPMETISSNVMGTTVALEVARQVCVERFFYASTLYVYSPFGSFYRASKQAAEILVEAYHENYGLNYTLLRYGSLYGPRSQNWNGLKKYVDQVVREGKLKYLGTGNERREYIHVEDAARLTVDALDSSECNNAVTLSGSESINSSDLIEMIFEIAGVEKNVEYSEDDTRAEHYKLTPYRYTPKAATKVVPSQYVDLGQGILNLVEEVHQEIETEGEAYQRLLD
jgi:UDP-glucose 4-epimerase